MKAYSISTFFGLFWTICSSSTLAVPLAGFVAVPGDATDKIVVNGVNQNRLGGFNSSLHYDPVRDIFYGGVDRGAGGGVFSYETRFQEFKLNVNRTTGAISDFELLDTILFRTADGSAPFNGQSPLKLNNSPTVLGLSFDPEGLAVAPNGRLFVADEYGPSIYEFVRTDVGGNVEARFVRAFAQPDNVLPRDANGMINYEAIRSPTPPDPALVSGRQDSRGYEGIAISPDGSKIYAALQDPLVEEGASNEGRRSRNAHIVEFDVATGQSRRQFFYQLTDRAEVNSVIDVTNADPAADIGGTGQGRTLVISDFVALNDHQFLVTERDNRGFGDANPALTDPILSAVGLKAIYMVDITDATDVSHISFQGSNDLLTPDLPGNPSPPITVTPVSKSLVIDVRAALVEAGLPIPEKIEGITLGPQLDNGNYALIAGSDNDFSVS